jgi:hypothetical protein
MTANLASWSANPGGRGKRRSESRRLQAPQKDSRFSRQLIELPKKRVSVKKRYAARATIAGSPRNRMLFLRMVSGCFYFRNIPGYHGFQHPESPISLTWLRRGCEITIIIIEF